MHTSETRHGTGRCYSCEMHPLIEVPLHLKQVGFEHRIILTSTLRATVLSEVIPLIRSNVSEGGNGRSILIKSEADVLYRSLSTLL